MRAKKRVSTRDGKEEPSSFIVPQKKILLSEKKALFRKVLSPIRQIQRVAEVSVNDMNARARRVV